MIQSIFYFLSLKSVRIWSFSDPYFPTFELNKKRYGVSHRIFSPNAGKYGPKKLRIQTLFTVCLWWQLRFKWIITLINPILNFNNLLSLYICWIFFINLTHFMPLISFDTPKTSENQKFSVFRGIKRDQKHEMS